jgi:hypothetical protein
MLTALVNGAHLLSNAAVPALPMPATRGHLLSLAAADVDALLAFYNVPNLHPGAAVGGEELAIKTRALGRHLSVKF